MLKILTIIVVLLALCNAAAATLTADQKDEILKNITENAVPDTNYITTYAFNDSGNGNDLMITVNPTVAGGLRSNELSERWEVYHNCATTYTPMCDNSEPNDRTDTYIAFRDGAVNAFLDYLNAVETFPTYDIGNLQMTVAGSQFYSYQRSWINGDHAKAEGDESVKLLQDLTTRFIGTMQVAGD